MTTSTNNSVNTTAKINVTEGNRVIESAKVTVDEAVAILNRLNYMGATFQYRFTTREYNADIEYRNFDAYKADGTGVRFSLTEIVINGKLEVVRFHNHYRNIVVDLQVGNVAYTYGYKGEVEIVETDDDPEPTDDTPAEISYSQFTDLMAWAEKISNGQHDASIQIKTHLKLWLNADVDQISIIEHAKELNDFRIFLTQFNFIVKDDAGYLYKLFTYESGECILGDADFVMPTNDAPTSEKSAVDKLFDLKEMIKVRTGKGNRQMWFGYGKLISKAEAEEYLHQYGLTIDEYLAALPAYEAECDRRIDEAFAEHDKNLATKNTPETDGSEDDTDENPFDSLPELDELNDVDEDEPTSARAQSTSRRLTPTDEHKPTVEIKTAKNGTKIFYADRKRVSRDTALKIAEQNRGENLFYLEWEHEVNAYYVGGGVESSFHPAREELRELDIRIDEYHGYTVKVNGSSLHTFSYKENAVWLVNAIIKAYVGGERGIKIERSGQVVIVDAAQTKTA